MQFYYFGSILEKSKFVKCLGCGMVSSLVAQKTTVYIYLFSFSRPKNQLGVLPAIHRKMSIAVIIACFPPLGFSRGSSISLFCIPGSVRFGSFILVVVIALLSLWIMTHVPLKAQTAVSISLSHIHIELLGEKMKIT